MKGKLLYCIAIIFYIVLHPIKIWNVPMSYHKSKDPKIKEKYPLYTQLLKERKSVIESPINVSEPKKNNGNYLTTKTFVRHISLNDEIIFTIEVNQNNYKHFHFLLRCINLTNRPFFHYDSNGTAHRNYDEDSVPLKFQMVKTPHFNCFLESGLSWAYYTDQLKDSKERIALQDISLCLAHFCHESNIRLGEDSFPEINIAPGTLQFDIDNQDPNKGVQFL